MVKKKLGLLVLLLLSLGLLESTCNVPLAKAQNPGTFTTAGAVPSKLAVYLGPPTVQTDDYCDCVFVQLQDALGNPAYAPDNGVGVSLYSSNTTVGTVDASITIYEGRTFVKAYFYSTVVPGTTIIAASVSGYGLATATLTTVTPSLSPTKLAVYTAPPMVAADNTASDYPVTGQLQDATGKPAMTSSDVAVSFSSSDPLIGTVSTPATIPMGSTYAHTDFHSTYAAGNTTITAISTGFTQGSAIMKTFAPIPTKLVVYTPLPSLSADSRGYNDIIFAQLQDAAGNPARAPTDTGVSFSSSNSTIGSVSSPATIYAGSTYTTTRFTSTYTPGTTVITASAIGYVSGTCVIKTVAPQPTRLVVYPGPPLPADNNAHYTAVVQLQDAAGNPAYAPQGDVSVVLTSSNPAIGTVGSPVTIYAGYSYVQIRFSATYTVGSTLITAASVGYQTGSATMKTVAPSGSPSKLAVYSVPPAMPADNTWYSNCIIVQLQDASGNPAIAPIGDVGISLSSSNPSIGAAGPSGEISQGNTHTAVWFDSTYTPGSTTVNAVATKYTSGSCLVTTTGATPARIAVYAALPKLPADNTGYHSIVYVQLQDAAGNPARAPLGGVGVSLWSSNPQVGTVWNARTVDEGYTYVNSGFYPTYVPGSTNVVAFVSMFPSILSLSVTPTSIPVGGLLTISGQLWPKISTTLHLYYRSGISAWTLATTITTSSTGTYSITVSVPSIPKGTYELVMVWMGSGTYKGAVSEIRSFTVV